MAILSVKEFNTSRFSQMADTTDANITSVLQRAEAAIKRQLQRPIEAEEFEEEFYPENGIIYLRNRPVLSINEIRVSGYLQSNPAISTMYSLDKRTGRIQFLRAAGRRVSVNYTAGYEEDDIPPDLKEAVAMQAVLFLYTDLEIYGVGDGKEPGIMYFKRDIADLLRPYKQLHLAYT